MFYFDYFNKFKKKKQVHGAAVATDCELTA